MLRAMAQNLYPLNPPPPWRFNALDRLNFVSCFPFTYTLSVICMTDHAHTYTLCGAVSQCRGINQAISEGHLYAYEDDMALWSLFLCLLLLEGVWIIWVEVSHTQQYFCRLGMNALSLRVPGPKHNLHYISLLRE